MRGPRLSMKHHDPAKLLRVQFIQRRPQTKKETASVAVCCEIAIGLRAGRLGLKKLAFLQEHDDRLSAASAK